MKKIIILGAGFSGMAAASTLKRSGLDLEITIIDRRPTTDFLPLLPDTIGRGIQSEYLAFSIRHFAGQERIKFIQAQVTAVDLEKKEVILGAEHLSYDYLAIASGSETNFYGNENIREHAYKLNSVEDAGLIARAIKNNQYDSFLICGGGYTGIEVATNLRIFLKKIKKESRIIILERANSILGALPQWMKDYTFENLRRLSIEVILNSSLERMKGDKAFLSGGKALERTLVIWAAGVKTADFIQNLKAEKNPQGRIQVDEYLRLNPDCFVVGDTANFLYKNTYLRMAVQFSIFEGRLAAKNIIRSIKKKPLRKYRPIDFGYIIPMANNRSCGIVLGVKLKGRLPTFLHYLMCIYRSLGLKNKLGLMKNLLITKEVRDV